MQRELAERILFQDWDRKVSKLVHAIKGYANVDYVKELVNSDVDIEDVDNKGQTIVHHLVKRYATHLQPRCVMVSNTPITKIRNVTANDVISLLRLLVTARNINVLSDKGFTPIMLCVRKGTFAEYPLAKVLFDELLRLGADIKLSNQFNWSVFHIIVGTQRFHKQTYEHLLVSKADPTSLDNVNRTPLNLVGTWRGFCSTLNSHCTCVGGHSKAAIDFFVSNGCDINNVDETGKTFLMTYLDTLDQTGISDKEGVIAHALAMGSELPPEQIGCCVLV